MTKPIHSSLAVAKEATSHTEHHQHSVRRSLPFHNRQSFTDAQRGFIATLEPLQIPRKDGSFAYDLSKTAFLQADAPATVNPSLWRQAQLNAHHHGLFEVAEGLYQVRSFDIANMTLIKGETGWLIIDPLTCTESSAAALALANQHLGEREVVGIIFTHSHIDHFGGVLGVASVEQLESGNLPVLAPPNFVDESLNENVMAGNAMNRRATYMYGNLLPADPKGFVTTGLGAALAMGTTGFAVPNDTVHATGDTRNIDGIEIEFQITMGTEAPSEMVFYFPKYKALCMSEITSQHLHNLYTPRGAQVRDALSWSQQIQESIDLFGDRLDVQFASHHWPVWGRKDAVSYLSKQRDLYKYIHDQTLRLANHGFTKEEIADQVELPPSLANEFYNRDYYGTVHHNVRAVYVRYLGYFDGNPCTLYPLPPEPAAQKYLAFMGGADAVVTKAKDSFDQGDYRWVVEVLNHVVMAEPGHETGKALLADALEQLGYQSESGPWRNIFLCGAFELRHGLKPGANFRANEGMARAMPLQNLFSTLAVRLNGPRAAASNLHFNLTITDLSLEVLLSVQNGVLHAQENKQHTHPDAKLTASSLVFKRLMLGLAKLESLVSDGELTIRGNTQIFIDFQQLFDEFTRRFPIMTPRGTPN